MDEFIGWVICFVAVLVVIGFVIDGIVWVVINLWWMLLPIAATVLVWLFYQHPGVRAKREIRAVVTRGNRQRDNIAVATMQAKAEMDRIARNWNNSK
jgi:flagellar motor component MotA